MIRAIRIIGLNSDSEAALSLSSYNTTDPSISLGFFVLAYVRTDDAFAKTRQILSDALDNFTASTNSLPERIGESLEFIKKSLEGAEDLQVVVASTQEDANASVLYLQGKGDQLNAFLMRDGTRANLGDVAEGQLVSGVLKEEDRVILTTTSLMEILGEDFSKVGQLPLEVLEDEVAGFLPEAQPYPLAAVVFEKEKRVEEKIEEEAIQEVIEPKAKSASLSLGAFIGLVKGVFGKLLPRSKRGMAILGITFLLVVLVGLGLTYVKQKGARGEGEFSKNYQLAADAFSKSQSLKDLDQAAALSSLKEARESVEQALKIKPKDQKSQDLKKQIEGAAPDILKIYAVIELPVWLDLDLIKKGFSARKLSMSLGNLLLLDESKGTLITIDTSKSHEILAGEEKLGDAKESALNGDVAWVFSDDKGIIKVEGAKKEPKKAIGVDKEWGNIVDIYGFGGNIYLLDESSSASSSGQIWKYVPIENGYSDKRAYFKEGVKVDLSGVKRMEIDSSVWILKRGGEILKYTSGSPDFFSIGGLDKGLGDPNSFFVSDRTDNVYILDSGNNRLVVVDKKGAYKAQYTGDKFGSFTDLVVDEKDKKAYFLQGSKIYLLELR